MPRITIACPAALTSDANQLAAALGQSMADAETYGPPGWQDNTGNLYAAASLDVSEAWLEAAQQPLARPAWDTEEQIDMTAAARAQAAVVLLSEPAPATPDALTALVWPNGLEALALMGVAPIPGEAP